MTFPKAETEFQIRYYLWAASEWEKEIEQSFPNLRAFKTGSAWQTCQYLQQLGKREQLIVAQGFLKTVHAGAVKTLGQTCSPDEESFRWRCDEFFRIREQYQWLKRLEGTGQAEEARVLFHMLRPDAIKLLGEYDPPSASLSRSQQDASLRSQLEALFRPVPPTFEEELAARRRAGEMLRFVGKRKLQETIMTRFEAAFGDRCIESAYDDVGDPWSSYDMKCCGWILRTHFWFGRQRSLINYSHLIVSPAFIRHPTLPDITSPTLRLALQISFCAWLGIASQFEMAYLTKDDYEPACDRAVELCGHFFDVAPRLLAGLEFKKIETIEKRGL